ncbi:hypothetical protein Pst134EB_033422 [Puccinia striiformis f. sp. tritici]|nr:hypothetical protein Pst134EB_033422 [Puccinia striiformis f. sp. tritici]
MANKYNYATATFDVSSAYPYSPIDEEVYVQPPVEIRPEWKGKIMRLKKAMYGTKQAARCWWQFFKQKMENVGFVASELEQSVYIYWRGGEFVIIWLHVDDGFVVGSSKELLRSLREAMEKELKIKWSEGYKRLVGINIKKEGGEVVLDQEKLAMQIVNDYERPIVTRRSTLPDEPLEVNPYDPVGSTEYRSIVGSLMYLAGGTRPDMSYAVWCIFMCTKFKNFYYLYIQDIHPQKSRKHQLQGRLHLEFSLKVSQLSLSQHTCHTHSTVHYITSTTDTHTLYTIYIHILIVLH